MSQHEAHEHAPVRDAWRRWDAWYDRDRSLLVRAIYEHRSEILACYPCVQLPSGEPGISTPVAALVTAWDRWDDFRGECPDCSAPSLGTTFYGNINHGHVVGVCTACALVVWRDRCIVGSVARARASVADTPWQFTLVGIGWRFVGVPRALVAVLGELGVDNLPAPRHSGDEERD